MVTRGLHILELFIMNWCYYRQRKLKMKTKKILHIISNMDDGGAQRVVLDYLERKGSLNKYDLEFLSLNPPTNSTYDIYIKHNKLPFKYLEYKRSNMRFSYIRKAINWIRRTIALYRFIQEHNIDALHTHITPIFIDVIFIFIVFQGEKFHTMHSDPYRFSKMFVLIVKFVFHFLHVHPIAVSEGQRQKALIRYSLSECDVLRNSIDIAAIKEFADRKNNIELRKKYNLPGNTFIIGSVGRLHPVKNYDGLIKIFAKYNKERNKQSCLVIAGEGKERDNLLALAESLDISGNVFLLGDIEHHNIYEFYKAIDLFMLVSHSESSSIVTLEAQAVGVRCLIADTIPEDVIYRSNVRRMNYDASYSEWISAIDDMAYINPLIYDAADNDLNTVMARLEVIYDKYCN